MRALGIETAADEAQIADVVEIARRAGELVRDRVKEEKPRLVRRRANQQQGRALEILGHAVEYLADSRLFLPEEEAYSSRNNQDAMQLLMRMSRAVFSECREVVTLWERMGRAVDKLWSPPT